MTKLKLAVLIGGLPCSGKTTVAQLLARKLSAELYSLGDIIREEAAKLNVDPSIVASQLRVRQGRRIVASRLVEKLKMCNTEIAIVEGIRGIEEVEEIRDKLNVKTYLVYVVASRPIRESRFQARGRADDVTIRQLVARDLRESAYGLAELIVYADKIIVNDFPDVESLDREIDKLCQEILRLVS